MSVLNTSLYFSVYLSLSVLTLICTGSKMDGFTQGGASEAPPSILANYEPMAMKFCLHGNLDVFR